MPPTGAPSGLPETPTLADFISAARGNGTYQSLEQRMPLDSKGAHSPGWKRLQQIVRRKANGQRELLAFPDPATIRALAVGLGVHEEAITLACHVATGLTPRGARSRFETLVLGLAGLELLTDEDIAMDLQIIRAQIGARRTSQQAT